MNRGGEWNPLIESGDGAWIGVMASGEIGVGVLEEERASLVASKYIPMWAFMERDLSVCLDKLRQAWGQLGGRGVSAPEELVERTVRSAWSSGRPYWMQLAATWMLEMTRMPEFDRTVVRDILESDIDSRQVPSGLLARLDRASREN
jgi:hypothetical protein